MEYSNRNVQTQAAAPGAQGAAAPGGKKKRSADKAKLGRIGVVAAVAAVVVLLGAIIAITATGNNKQEDKFVDSSKLQAVFLNTGQVYFGNIKTLNDKYFVVSNIYYLQTSANGSSTTAAANSNTSVSLVKLGCELHEPLDQMVINRDQVTFWENLGDNGQVATAVATFKKQNPNGQKCADQSTSAGTNTTNSAQNAGSNTGTTNTTTTTNP